jgi:hypothetical protein
MKPLKRDLNELQIWSLALGAIIGWGCFVLPGNKFLPTAGPLGTAIGLVGRGADDDRHCAQLWGADQSFSGGRRGVYVCFCRVWSWSCVYLCVAVGSFLFVDRAVQCDGVGADQSVYVSGHHSGRLFIFCGRVGCVFG